MNLILQDIDLTLGDFNLQCSLDIPSGRLTTLLGPSGCGKTSLLKSVAGLYSLDRGSIELGKRDITHVDSRYRKIGMVFQDYALFPHMNVEKNIRYGMKQKGEEAAARCRDLLEMVELSGFGGRQIEELSGGEKQRVALARALASEPDLLLLDEPLSALDARLRRILRRQIREIQQKTGITTLYVTHDQEEAMAISDMVVLMDSGRVSQYATPEEIYSAPLNIFSGNFFGTANLIPLQESYRILGDFNLSAIPCKTEDLRGACLFFRPEDCRLVEGPSGEHDPKKELSCTGTVLYREYGGDFHYIEVSCGDYPVKIKTREKLSFSEGTRLNWVVSLRDCRILH